MSPVARAVLAHELLHIRRQFLERAPHLFPKRKEDGKAAAVIDNWLEHTFIYGPQMKLVPEFRQVFNRDMQEFWTSGVLAPLDDINLRFNLLTRALIVELVGSGETKAVMRGTLQRDYRKHKVSAAMIEAKAVLGDKVKFARFAFDYSGFPKRPFWLRRVGWTPGANEWWDFEQPGEVHRG